MKGFFKRLFGKKKDTNSSNTALPAMTTQKKPKKKSKKAKPHIGVPDEYKKPRERPALAPWAPDQYYSPRVITPMPKAGPARPSYSQAPSFMGSDFVPKAHTDEGAHTNAEGLAFFRNAFLRTMNVSNSKPDRGNALGALGLRDSGSRNPITIGTNEYAGSSFRGLDYMNTSYFRQLAYNYSPNQLDNMDAGRSPDGSQQYNQDAYTFGVGRDMLQMFFDHIENNESAREYLWYVADELKRAKVFGGSMKDAFRYVVGDAYLRRGGLSSQMRNDEFYEMIQDPRFFSARTFAKDGNAKAQKVAGLFGEKEGGRLYQNGSDDFRALYDYYGERITNLIEMMKVQ